MMVAGGTILFRLGLLGISSIVERCNLASNEKRWNGCMWFGNLLITKGPTSRTPRRHVLPERRVRRGRDSCEVGINGSCSATRRNVNLFTRRWQRRDAIAHTGGLSGGDFCDRVRRGSGRSSSRGKRRRVGPRRGHR